MTKAQALREFEKRWGRKPPTRKTDKQLRDAIFQAECNLEKLRSEWHSLRQWECVRIGFLQAAEEEATP